MAPRALIRDPTCVSNVSAITEGTRFLRLIPEQSTAILPSSDAVNTNVRRLIFCAGKVIAILMLCLVYSLYLLSVILLLLDLDDS